MDALHQLQEFGAARRNIERRWRLSCGQCGFRPLHWTLAGLFVKYDMGLYREGNSQLYVNTGTGYWLLPWRLGLAPEITVVELR